MADLITIGLSCEGQEAGFSMQDETWARRARRRCNWLYRGAICVRRALIKARALSQRPLALHLHVGLKL